MAAAQPIRHGLLGVHQHLQGEELGGHQHLHQRPHHARVLAGVEEAGGAAEVADPAHRIGQGSDNDPTIGGPPTRAGEKNCCYRREWTICILTDNFTRLYVLCVRYRFRANFKTN